MVTEPTTGSSRSHIAGRSPTLAVDRITQVFEKDGEPLVALNDVSLDVRPGEFLTLVGPSGCGKSTLLKIIAGLLNPTAGSVYLGGSPVTEPGRRSV